MQILRKLLLKQVFFLLFKKFYCKLYFHTDNEDSEGRLISYSDKLDVFTAAFVHARSYKLIFEKCRADLCCEWDTGEVLEWQKLETG